MGEYYNYIYNTYYHPSYNFVLLNQVLQIPEYCLSNANLKKFKEDLKKSWQVF